MTFPHTKNQILELSKTLYLLFLKYFPFQSVLVQLQNPVVQCIRAASCKSTLKMFPVAHVQNSFFQRQCWCHQHIALWVWLHRNPKYLRDCVHHAYQKQLSLCQILGFAVIIGPSWWGSSVRTWIFSVTLVTLSPAAPGEQRKGMPSKDMSLVSYHFLPN